MTRSRACQPTPTSDIRRKDTGHVDPSMRPSEEFYKRVSR